MSIIKRNISKINTCYTKIINRLHAKVFGQVSLLRKLGGTVGKGCRFVGHLDFGSEPYLISIGNNVSITSSSFVNHDGGVWVFRNEYPAIDVVKPIIIKDNVFIGSNCIIMPGVTIGSNVVVGAGAVITKDLPDNAVYAGVPAKKIKSIVEYQNGVLENNLDTKDIKFKRDFLEQHFKL